MKLFALFSCCFLMLVYSAVCQEIMIFCSTPQSNPGRNIITEFLNSYKVPFRMIYPGDLPGKFSHADSGIVFCFNETMTPDLTRSLTDFVQRGGFLVINGGCFREGADLVHVSAVSEAGTSRFFFLNKPSVTGNAVLNACHEIVDVFSTPLQKRSWRPMLYGHEYVGDRTVPVDPSSGRKYLYYALSESGKGGVLYIASLFPLLGYGASDTIEEFILLRKVMLDYFRKRGGYLYRIHPWPLGYDVAIHVRHDFDRSMKGPGLEWVYQLIDVYQKEEQALGVRGNYFIRTDRFMEDGGKLLEQLKGLDSLGKIRVLSHSRSHGRFDLDPVSGKGDILKSFEDIARDFGDRGTAFVFPFYHGVSAEAHGFMEDQGIWILGEQTLGLPYPFFTVNIHDRDYRKYTHIQLPVSVYPAEKSVELEFSNILETLSHFNGKTDLLGRMIERLVSCSGLINSYTHFRIENASVYKTLFSLLKKIDRLWKPSNEEMYGWWVSRDRIQLETRETGLEVINGNSVEVSFSVIREDGTASRSYPVTLGPGQKKFLK